jgi:hypothetical protein
MGRSGRLCDWRMVSRPAADFLDLGVSLGVGGRCGISQPLTKAEAKASRGKANNTETCFASPESAPFDAVSKSKEGEKNKHHQDEKRLGGLSRAGEEAIIQSGGVQPISRPARKSGSSKVGR